MFEQSRQTGAWRLYYGAAYAVDIPELTERLNREMLVLHLGQVPAVDAVQVAVPARWLVVALHTPRDVAAERLRERNPDDVAERLAAWDATAPCLCADLTIDTNSLTPQQAAQLIRAQVPDQQGADHP